MPSMPGTDGWFRVVLLQGWLNHRPISEHDIIMSLFEESFPYILRYAVQNLTFKMEMLEAFVITQVHLKLCAIVSCGWSTSVFFSWILISFLNDIFYSGSVALQFVYFVVGITICVLCRHSKLCAIVSCGWPTSSVFFFWKCFCLLNNMFYSGSFRLELVYSVVIALKHST